MKQNFLRLKQGQLVINRIKHILEDIKRSLPYFIFKFNQGEEMRNIEIMVENARKKVNNANKIYHFCNLI